MDIPNFVDAPIVDKNGHLTSIWKQILTQLITELQKSVSEEGFKIPQQPTSNIAKLNNLLSKGHLIYDSDTNQLKININGTIKVIQVI